MCVWTEYGENNCLLKVKEKSHKLWEVYKKLNQLDESSKGCSFAQKVQRSSWGAALLRKGAA